MSIKYSRTLAKSDLATNWQFSPAEAEALVSRADRSATGTASARKPGYRTALVTRKADGTYTVEEGN